MMTWEEKRSFIRQVGRVLRRLGSQRAAAKALGVSVVLLHLLTKGEYPYMESIAAKLGERVRAILAAPPDQAMEPKATRRTARDRLWQSMRILRRFSISDLAGTAEVAYDSARHYVRHLEKVGLLRRVVPHGNQPRQAAMFQLAIDSGPRAPRVVAGNTAVHDPNRNVTLGGPDHE